MYLPLLNRFGKYYLAFLYLAIAVISPALGQTTDSDILSKIVKIQGPNDEPGTGFVFGPDKRGRCLLLTAKHTMFDHIEYGNDKFKIYLSNDEVKEVSPNSFFFPSDPYLDLAAAQVQCDGMEINVPFAKRSSISIATPVKVFGYPKDKHDNDIPDGIGSMVEGIVTKYGSSRGARESGFNISYSALTFPGYSGGPVLSENLDELIAIHGFSFTVDIDPNNQNSGEQLDYDSMTKDERTKYLRVGGSGISSSRVYRFLRENGYIMRRSKKAPCLVGVC